MSTQDDENWFEAIAGRPRPDMAPGTRAEGLWLRRALRAQQAANAALAAPIVPSDKDADRLLAAARAEGLLAGSCRSCDAVRRLWQALRWPARLPLAAAGLGMALAMLFVLAPWPRSADNGGEPGAETILRGDAVQLLRDADPAGRRARIALLLTDAGVPVRLYERLGRLGLDAQIPDSLRPRLTEALAREHGLRLDADGGLRVEIE